MSNKMTGADILIEMLEREKVDVIFGYPGGSVLPIFDKLYDAKVKFVLTRHEQGAAHAADGYARASGKTGVCMATSGPGATNLDRRSFARSWVRLSPNNSGNSTVRYRSLCCWIRVPRGTSLNHSRPEIGPDGWAQSMALCEQAVSIRFPTSFA